MSWVLRNWLVLVVVLAVLSIVGSYLDGRDLHRLVALGWAATALLALVDGVRRALGRPSLLGHERGFGRLLAVVQIVLAALLLLSLLSAFVLP